MDLSVMSNDELVFLYSSVIKEMKNRGVLRTGNVTGELGERIVIDIYGKNGYLPTLKAVPLGTENYNAIDSNGKRYSIKSTSGHVTGVFYGLEPPDSKKDNPRLFDYPRRACQPFGAKEPDARLPSQALESGNQTAEKRSLGAIQHLNLHEIARLVGGVGPYAHLAVAGAAAKLFRITFGRAFHQNREHFTHIFTVAFQRQAVLEGDNLFQAAVLHFLRHIVGIFARRQSARTFGIIEHVGGVESNFFEEAQGIAVVFLCF